MAGGNFVERDFRTVRWGLRFLADYMGASLRERLGMDRTAEFFRRFSPADGSLFNLVLKALSREAAHLADAFDVSSHEGTNKNEILFCFNEYVRKLDAMPEPSSDEENKIFEAANNLARNVRLFIWQKWRV